MTDDSTERLRIRARELAIPEADTLDEDGLNAAIAQAEAAQAGELEPTLEQLRDRARELDVKGRSKLSREDLEAAIVKAEAEASSSAAGAVPEDEPLTPEQTGRPPLAEVAEQRAANRKPRRVIGEDPTNEEDR